MIAFDRLQPPVHRTDARLSGVFLVGVLHVALCYALVSGLARTVVDIVKGPLETRVIEEVREKPDEPPPPPPPKLALPPPPFVPPPEIAIEVSVTAQQAAIASVATRPVEAAPPPPPVERPRQPVRVAPVVQASSCKTPEYPTVSRRQRESGAVVLSFLVGVDGRVLDSRVDHSSGHPRLDEAALRALSLCGFTPGTVDGRPEESWHKLRFVWQLDR